MNIEAVIKKEALALGFDLCGFARATAPATAAFFAEWLAQGFHGEMAWIAARAALRKDPQLLLPGACSVVAVAATYEGPQAVEPFQALPRPSGYIACYARYADYHTILGEKLAALATLLNRLGGADTRSLWYTDTGPVLERDFAQSAGVGFVGKHTNLISRTHGNWLLLGEVITTLELAPDPPEKNRCGSCTRCLAACPTQAIVAPFRLDARRCLSYLTIELKGPIPLDLRPAIGRRVFGCDDCLAVCPWNRFAHAGALLSQHARPDLATPELLALLALDEAGFKRRFAGTPLQRAKRRGLLRNVCVALGNTGDHTAQPALEQAARDPEPLIAEHARWALEQLRGRL
jgi:epoxyqueuosine reductase